MKTSEQKLEQIRLQVISKIHWDARDQEVLEWLQERHGIAGDEADQMIKEAHTARRQAVRNKALWTMGFSAVGIVIFFLVMAAQGLGRFVVVGFPMIVFIGVGIISMITFLRALIQLVTGRTNAPID